MVWFGFVFFFLPQYRICDYRGPLGEGTKRWCPQNHSQVLDVLQIHDLFSFRELCLAWAWDLRGCRGQEGRDARLAASVKLRGSRNSGSQTLQNSLS